MSIADIVARIAVSPTEAKGFLRRIKRGEPLWRALDRRTWNRACNILEGIKVDGGWIERPQNDEGRNWVIHIDPFVSESTGAGSGGVYPPPRNPSQSSSGGGGEGFYGDMFIVTGATVDFAGKKMTITRRKITFANGSLTAVGNPNVVKISDIVAEPAW